MGKYDDISANSQGDLFLKKIANELAEANRLKRAEMVFQKWTNNNGVEFDCFRDSELEDDA